MSAGEVIRRRAPGRSPGRDRVAAQANSRSAGRAEVDALLKAYVVSRDYDAQQLRTQGGAGGGRSSWTTRAESRLIQLFEPRIRAAVEHAQRRYPFACVDVELAMQEGRWGVARALRAYDPERGPFDVFVGLKIRTGVGGYVRDMWLGDGRGVTFLRRLWAAGVLGKDPDPATWPDAGTVAQRWREMQLSAGSSERDLRRRGLWLSATDVEAIISLGHPGLTLLSLADDARGPEAAYEDPVADQVALENPWWIRGEPDIVSVVWAVLLDLARTYPGVANAVAVAAHRGAGRLTDQMRWDLALLAEHPDIRRLRPRVGAGSEGALSGRRPRRAMGMSTEGSPASSAAP